VARLTQRESSIRVRKRGIIAMTSLYAPRETLKGPALGRSIRGKRAVNSDADVAPRTALDALDDGDRLGLRLAVMPVVPPRRREAQGDQPVRTASRAKDQVANGATRPPPPAKLATNSPRPRRSIFTFGSNRLLAVEVPDPESPAINWRETSLLVGLADAWRSHEHHKHVALRHALERAQRRLRQR
jgi:hypothetical protein